jgi:BirA family biotin operon repressor/biotin-[acetyl-CoA-carboxylase] ligase
MGNNLSAAIIQQALGADTRAALRGIHVFSQLDSTNRWTLEEGQCGDVCLAEQQTAGRGRRGRQWQSPAAVNLYFSLRWCFDAVPTHLPLLSLVTGLAVAEALADCGIHGHGLKWPNDVVLPPSPALRKLGGILLEAVGTLDQVVIGIGLNVNMQTDSLSGIDQPWASLRDMLGANIDRNTLVAALIQRLIPRLLAFPQLDMAQFQQDWQRWDVLANRPVRVLSGNNTVEGFACGIDAQGQLRLALEDGLINVFSSADVSVRL